VRVQLLRIVILGEGGNLVFAVRRAIAGLERLETG
jgi:hypothetical protein